METHTSNELTSFSNPQPPLYILKRARYLLRHKTSWRQGDYTGENKDGYMTYCLLGALGMTKEHQWERTSEVQEAIDILNRAIRNLYPNQPRTNRIFIFNDSPETTHDEILKVLDKAIEYAELEPTTKGRKIK